MVVRNQLDDVPRTVEEVGSRGAAVGVHDRRALLHVRVAVEGEQLVPLGEPGRGVADRAARDVDREVVTRLCAGGSSLEAKRRLLQRHLERVVDSAYGQPERRSPE